MCGLKFVLMDWTKDSKTHPAVRLSEWAKEVGCEVTDEKFAKWLDCNDKLAKLKQEFVMPSLSSDDSGTSESFDCSSWEQWCSYETQQPWFAIFLDSIPVFIYFL